MSKVEVFEAAKEAFAPITAAELVGLIAKVGPGGIIKVDATHLPSETIRRGYTRWNDDRAAGPAVVFPDLEKVGHDLAVLPLGGNLVYLHPPRISLYSDSRVRQLVSTAATPTTVHQRPIDPIAQEYYRFEIIS